VIQATLIDGCGDTVSNTAFISGADAISYSQNWTTFSAGACQVKNSNDFTYTMPKPNQWVLINNTTRAIVKTGTNLPDSASSSANDVFISGVNADTTYMLKVFDHCGDTLSTSFLWPEAYITPRYYMGAEIFACLDSTSAEDISYTGYSSGMTLTVLSGPSGAHSSKPGYAYNYTYTYPRVFHNANTDGDFHLSDLAAGTYVYTIADSCGHTNTDSFSINSAFLVTFSNSFSYLRGCNNENTLTFQFIGSQGTFAQIKINCQITNTATGDTLFNNLVTGFNIYDSVYNVPAGTYKLSAQYVDVGYNMTNGSSCSQVTATVTVLPYRNPALSSVTDVICGGSIYITALMDSATGVPPYIYQVINGPQVTSTQSSNKFTVSKYGTYTILALDACGNSTTQSKQIDSTAGIMRVTNHIDSCFSATVAGQTYTTNTVLIDTIQNSLGCDSLITTDSISIRGNGDQLPILTVAADTFCITKGGTVTAVSSYASYLWGDGSTGLSIHVSAAGSYGLTVTDAVGCTHSDAAVVSLIDSPYVTNGWFADTAACPDAPVVVGLAVNDPDAHYQWGGTDAGTFGLTRTIVDSGIYTFSISNSCASSSYTMNVANKMYCYEYLYVPNAFTPNGDGVNDVFLIYTDYNLKLTNLQIFDRWGEKVYEGHDESQGWDGTYKGTAQPGGMYVYQLDATWLGGNTFHRRGSLTLLR
jgi:gliding motility-associated-like protein